MRERGEDAQGHLHSTPLCKRVRARVIAAGFPSLANQRRAPLAPTWPLHLTPAPGLTTLRPHTNKLNNIKRYPTRRMSGVWLSTTWRHKAAIALVGRRKVLSAWVVLF